MPYIAASPAASPPLHLGRLPSAPSSIAFRLDSSDSLPTLSSSQCSSSCNSDEDRHSSPPTPETGAPSSASSSPTAVRKPLEALPSQLRPYRNHSRTQSGETVAALPALASNRRDSSDSIASSSSSLIYLHPASPPTRNEDGILISNPVTSDTSPRTKNKLSLFSLGAPDGTEWPEGEAADGPDEQHAADEAWDPPLEIGPPQPSSSYAFPLASTSSSATTPTPRSALKAARKDLRVDTDPAAARTPSPLPTPMVRKKSGELVRSSLKQNYSSSNLSSGAAAFPPNFRAKSAPATPTGPKAVHFSKELEHVKLFLAQQRPTAVSRQGSPGETTEEDSEAYPFPNMTAIAGRISLHLANFPSPPRTTACGRDVFIASLELLQDAKVLRGVIAVKNISFQKRVVVRFTTDDWQTISEVAAEYYQAVDNGQYDQWIFRIKLADMLARIEDKTMLLAVKYTVNSHDMWDNNDNANYVVQFRKEALVKAPPPTAPAERQASKYQWAVTTAGQASERMADLRKVLDRLVQDDQVPAPVAAPKANGTKERSFANRYDFNTALRQRPGRTGSVDSTARVTEDKQPYFHPVTSQVIGGMHATTLVEPLRQPRFAYAAAQGLSIEPSAPVRQLIYPGQHVAQPFPRRNNGSPPLTKLPLHESEDLSRAERMNSFPPNRWDGMPGPAPASASASSPQFKDKMPLQEHEELLRVERFNSFPPVRWDSATGASSTSNSLPPRSRQHPFAPPTEPGPLSPGLSPAVSPRSTSPTRESAFANGRRPRSPPPAISSPDFSTPSSSNDSSYDSPGRSYSPNRRSSATDLQEQSEPTQTYSNFLDKYCFFSPRQNTLGLTDIHSTSYFPPTDGLAPSHISGYVNGSNSTSSSSTPPRGSPFLH